MENLTFGQALDALKQGKKISRATWGGYWIMCSAQLFPKAQSRESLSLDVPMEAHKSRGIIIAILKDTGEAVPAQPYQADLLAEDWRILN
jgi:hypothetical protein